MIKILFVCSGNICRSPTAEAVFNHKVQEKGLATQMVAESAGIHDLHAGEPPDGRAIHHAQIRGYDLTDQTAQKINPQTFQDYRLIVCMDTSHYEEILQVCHPDDETKLKLLLHFVGDVPGNDVPDPYYGGPEDFEKVLDLVEKGVDALIESIEAQVL